METSTAAGLVGGRYRIGGLLGEGGMARVFDAFDERLARPVAVKILRPETLALPGMRERFQLEARIAARLVHPNIVAVLDYGEDHASSYLVMERLPGRTLRDEIARGPLEPRRAMVVIAETLAALATAHKSGVLHRDIKPSNILLQHDGHTKITDFGIAKSFDVRAHSCEPTDDMTLTGFVLGTPGYLAPERRSGRPASVQSDLYSVGAVMVEALTGERLPPGPVNGPQLPPAFHHVTRRALATDPQERFGSAADMFAALRANQARTAATPLAQTVPMTPAVGTTGPLAPPRHAAGYRGAPATRRGDAVHRSAPASPPPPGPLRHRPGRGGAVGGPVPAVGERHPAHRTGCLRLRLRPSRRTHTATE